MSNKVTSTAKNTNRINLYVDESGQDTRGKLFVAAIVTVENIDRLSHQCEAFEKSSDENEPLIRLADALAGAAAELIKYEDNELNALFSKAKQSGTIVEL